MTAPTCARTAASTSSWRLRVTTHRDVDGASSGSGRDSPSQAGTRPRAHATNGHLLPASLRLPLAIAVRAAGTWQPHPPGGAAQSGEAFQGLAASADEYLHMRLPEAVLLDPQSASTSLLETHAAAWACLLSGSAAYALVIQRGALLASSMRDSIKALLADVRALHAAGGGEWCVIHLLAVTGMPHIDGTPSGSLLRMAPEDSPGAPAYLLSRHGASRAADFVARQRAMRAAGMACGEGDGGEGAALYEALGQGGRGAYACAKAVAIWAEANGLGGGRGGCSPSGPEATTQRQLVTQLAKEGCFAMPGDPDPKLAIACMLALDRRAFASSADAAARAYRDAPLHLSQTVMSAPSTHARAAAALLPALTRAPGARALDVGAGSGYVSALLALCAFAGEHSGEGARVVVFEREASLAEAARRAAAAALRATALSQREAAAAVLEAASGDGRAGYAPCAPYDAIYVGGSCASVPVALLSQLKVGGRLLLAVGEADAPQDLTLVEKLSASRTRRTVLRGGIMMYGLK